MRPAVRISSTQFITSVQMTLLISTNFISVILRAARSNTKVRKRNELTLANKIKVIESHDEFGVGKTQINQILKRKAEYLDSFHENVATERCRKQRKTENVAVKNPVWDWFCAV